jgi:hypothetical protein
MKIQNIALSLVVVVTGCATGSSFVKPGYDFGKLSRVAVVEVTGANGNQAAQNEVADLFAMELLKRGYDVVERTQVQQILNEQDFQAGGATSPVDAVRVGRILNVSGIMVVNVPELGENVAMTAKMIHAETGTLLWMGEGTGKVGGGLRTVGGALVGAATGAAIGHQVNVGTGTTVGALGGGLAGGIAGRALEPTVSQALRRVVTKVAANMPSKVAR